jgi:ubiquinone/menaquinone biosynthesis C-methylase UbiE
MAGRGGCACRPDARRTPSLLRGSISRLRQTMHPFGRRHALLAPTHRTPSRVRWTAASGPAPLRTDSAHRVGYGVVTGIDLGDTRKQPIRAFWEATPCGSVHGASREGTAAWYDEIERHRDRVEPFINQIADFRSATGLRVLEVGVGVGTDFVKWARAGAHATGIDLTRSAIEHTQRRLLLEGLTGELLTADAETLPFPDRHFDLVYSWGVLHHTPDTAKAIAEAIRVLKPGGRLILMLYARRSWVGFGLWARYALLTGDITLSIADVIAGHLESKGTKAFTFAEVRHMCGRLGELRLRRYSTRYDRRVAGPLVKLLGDRLGWFIVVTGRAL